MFQTYIILGVVVFILGLWSTVTLLKARKEKAELERDIAKALVNESRKTIKHDGAIQKKIKQNATERNERINKKVKDDVEKYNFDDFYD
jgi:predicted Holliday junction resolvase-like endonuclease